MEENKDVKNEEKPTPEGSGEGDKPKATDVIEQADVAAKRLEAANTKQEELLNRQEEIMAKQRLGGKADAGEGSKEEKEDPIELSKKMEKGEVSMKDFLG